MNVWLILSWQYLSYIYGFKTTPSRIGNVLGMTASDLERIIYYEEYVVIDPGKTDLNKSSF